jgi:BASS family bile acid:Na+ symporter
MISVMMETTSGELTTMLQDRRKMGLGLLANLIIVPIPGFVLVRLLNLAPDIRIGIIMLAISPGGLLALQFARLSKGDRVFAVALVIVLTILAILITPLLADWLFLRSEAEGPPFSRGNRAGLAPLMGNGARSIRWRIL